MSTQDQPYTDEIDLTELLSVLWSGKWWILGVTGAALVTAFSWLSLTNPVYESEAVITAPAPRAYNPIYPGLLDDYAPEPKEVLGEVMNYMASPDRQRDFLANHIETRQRREEALDRAVERLTVNSNEEQELQGSSITIRYKAKDPAQAREQTKAFIKKTNEQVVDGLARNAQNRISRRVASLSRKIETQERAYRKELEQQIALLQAAEKQAQARGIENNQHNQSSSIHLDSEKRESQAGITSFATSTLQQPVFEYGTRALSALIDSRQQQLDQLLPSKALQLQSRKQRWESLNIRTENASVFSAYQSASQAEPTRSGFLVMALAGILGLIFGTILTLGRSAWKNNIAER